MDPCSFSKRRFFLLLPFIFTSSHSVSLGLQLYITLIYKMENKYSHLQLLRIIILFNRKLLFFSPLISQSSALLTWTWPTSNLKFLKRINRVVRAQLCCNAPCRKRDTKTLKRKQGYNDDLVSCSYRGRFHQLINHSE